MSEFLLDASETRPARAAAAPRGRSAYFKPILIGGACAAALAGFAVAASSVMADLVVPTKLNRGPAIGQGLAASWPDLKDGLPAKKGTPVTVTESKAAAPAAPAPRMASLGDPMAYPAGAAVSPPSPQPVVARSTPAKPTDRIPVPTEVAVVANASATKVIAPSRTVAALAPRPSETVRARDEGVKPVEEAAKPRDEAPHTREAAVEKPVSHHAAAKAKPVAAKAPAPEPAKVAAAKVAPPKPVATAAKPAVTHTATAEADSDETEILGVKLPSLAPAGQKLKDGVSALGDAVRNAF
ncbi:hypothetical protein [Methylobacterium persicinum]|uniref:Chemotaxis protein CheA n=1 Tax=Methylobacterium persicinum TaxID=374426 RepID=A0ABU0HH85_9HYPH|nr:hypothetical protein [Methylobacterium persicinum]MDQ0441681.1 hypothetical protein [Methylobacterium persicinum]GJE39442.1 hypothetical protein KHHGKMAE_3524 [Methylobacterium persicinum]